MGEKIRDIQPIRIGKASFMIELNEGYSASQGRLIHVQNNMFRYLLTEKDFFHLSSMILRAWKEFTHIKETPVVFKEEHEFCERTAVSHEMRCFIKEFAKGLSNKGIDYRVLDEQDEMLTILVYPKDMVSAEIFFKQNGAKAIHHPYGRKYGHRFLYQMEPFHLYKKGNRLLEVFCQLPCASMTAKTWIPLDRSIQDSVWGNKHEEDGVKYCCDTCKYVFHLCWAIFHNLGFSPYEKGFLDSRKELLSTDSLKEMLSVVFFNFSPVLIGLLENSQYDLIIPEYYSFCNY